MEEARRFLRYVIPGLLLFIEVSIYLFFSAHAQFISSLRKWGKDLAFPVTIFLASGGVGFLLGVVYHSIYWTKGFRALAVNHVPLIQDCVERGWLKLTHRGDGSKLDISKLTQSGAWRVVTAYWHERRECSERIKAANARTDSLTDIMHGLGATFVGSLFSIPLWIYIHKKIVCSYPSWFYYLLPLAFLFLNFVNYHRVVKDFRSVVDIIMSDDIKKEYDENKTPVVMNLSSKDYVDNDR
ncbi:MAG: hypothetical protein JRE64_23335 [Deltaproteobacteria bacterium]|nr:hypothetical protein [Deltaproteobacteria bacterium]